VDLVMRYGPLRGKKPYSKNLVLISALWALAQGLVIRYGPERRIWFSAMGLGAAFGYALSAIAQNQTQH
jgi:hypothetical protein